MNTSAVQHIAKRFDWKEIPGNSTNGMLSFTKEGMRINVWPTTETVSTCLNHPTRGPTQLFRKDVDLGMLGNIFKNPRIHTRRGYYSGQPPRTLSGHTPSRPEKYETDRIILGIVGVGIVILLAMQLYLLIKYS